jgi:Mannose-6-phosphate isomerase
MRVCNRSEVEAFVTKDTSTIREILAPRNAPGEIAHQSLAEASLPPGASTEPHFHPLTEEIYYILKGEGRMRVRGDVRCVGPGDAIAIPPGAPHQITNTSGDRTLVFLCCCAPAYSHEDTVMVSPDGWDG